MPSFDGGLFGLGFGSPEEPQNDPDVSGLADILNALDDKVYEDIVNRIQDPANLLVKLDEAISNGVENIVRIPREAVKRVDASISKNIGADIEDLSVKVSKLNNVAREKGIDLSQVSSDLLSSKPEGGLLGELRKPPEVKPFRPEAKPLDSLPAVDGNRLPGKQEPPEWLMNWIKTSGLINQPGLLVRPALVDNKWEVIPDETVSQVPSLVIGENDVQAYMKSSVPPPAKVDESKDETEYVEGFPQGDPVMGDLLDGPGITPEDHGLNLPPGGRGKPIAITQELPLGDPIGNGEGGIPAGIGNGQGCNICQQPVCICQQPDTGGYTTTTEQQVVGDVVNNYYTEIDNIENYYKEACPEEEEEEEKKIWCSYCNSQEGRIITLERGKQPPPPGFSLLTCSESALEASINAQDMCSIDQPQMPESVGRINAFRGLGLCKLNTYAPGLTQFNVYTEYKTLKPFTTFFGPLSTEEQSFWRQLLDGWNSTGTAGTIVRFIVSAGMWLANVTDSTIVKLLQQFADTYANYPKFYSLRLIIGAFEQWLSADFGQLKQPLVYATDAMNPVMYPTAAEAMQAYVTGTINEEVFQLWVQQNNMCFEPYTTLIDASRTKLAPQTALMAYWRGELTKPDFIDELKAQGYMYKSQHDSIEKANKFLPPVTDLIRFMVRDVFDKDKRDFYAPDVGFDKKWEKMQPKYGFMQGIDDPIAELYWRAHWIMPSTGQLYDFFHRSRGLPEGHKAKMGPVFLEQALQVNDNNPSWMPFLINSSYRILTRVDVRRAYRLGAIDQPEVRRNYRMRGYEETAVDALVTYANQDKVQFLNGRKETKLFQHGVINQAEFIEALDKYKPEDWMTVEVMKLAILNRQEKVMKACKKAAINRFVNGEIDDLEFMNLLGKQGFDDIMVEETLKQAECLKEARGKTMPIGKTCYVYKQGLINADEFIKRARNIGYSEEDGFMYLASCHQDLLDKTEKERQKEIRQKEAAAKKAAKALAKAAEKEAKQNERLRNNRIKRRQAEDRRELRLVKVITNLQKCTELDIDTTGQAVRDAMLQINFIYNFTSEERVSLLERTVERCVPKDIEEFNLRWKELADEMVSLEPLDLNHS